MMKNLTAIAFGLIITFFFNTTVEGSANQRSKKLNQFFGDDASKPITINDNSSTGNETIGNSTYGEIETAFNLVGLQLYMRGREEEMARFMLQKNHLEISDRVLKKLAEDGSQQDDRDFNDFTKSVSILYWGKYGMAVAIKKGNKHFIYISFSGMSDLPKEIVKEAIFYAARLGSSADLMGIMGGGKVTKGFKNLYKKEWDLLYTAIYFYAKANNMDPRDFFYRVSGHSMGGTLATLTTMRIAQTILRGDLRDRLKVVTFGMPKILNKRAADYYNCHLGHLTARVTIKGDWVTPLIPSPLFHHVGEQFHTNYEVPKLDKTIPHNAYDLALGNRVDTEEEFRAAAQQLESTKTTRNKCTFEHNRHRNNNRYLGRKPIERTVMYIPEDKYNELVQTIVKQGLYYKDLQKVVSAAKSLNLERKDHLSRFRSWRAK